MYTSLRISLTLPNRLLLKSCQQLYAVSSLWTSVCQLLDLFCTRYFALLDLLTPQHSSVLFFSAMFLIAFYGLFRIGELASKSTRVARSVIQYSNLTFSFSTTSVGQPQGATISIHQYKHNVSQRPFDVLLARDVSSPFCPVSTLFN